MAANQNRTMTWLGRTIDPDLRVSLCDITSGWGVLSLMGPRSRDILNKVSPQDFSLAAFPFGTMRQIEIGLAKAGADFGMVPAGYHALDSLRLEKGYRHWGHDIGDADTPLEAGLGFAVGLGYLHCPDGVTKEFVTTGTYEIEIAAERHPAEISLRPFFDPASERMKT